MLRLKTELARESIECHRLCKELQVSLSLCVSVCLSLSLSLSPSPSPPSRPNTTPSLKVLSLSPFLSRALSLPLSLTIYIFSNLSKWKEREREGLCSLSNCRFVRANFYFFFLSSPTVPHRLNWMQLRHTKITIFTAFFIFPPLPLYHAQAELHANTAHTNNEF